MSVNAQVEAVREAVTPVVGALGLDLYDVDIVGGGNSRTVRVTIDRPEGIDLDAITAATQAVSPVLDELPAFAHSGAYMLEVSSPGVERALRRPEHYRRAVGETVAIKFHTDAGPRRVQGALVEARDTACVVEVDADHERHTIEYDTVTGAHTVFEWGPQPRPGGAKPSKPKHRVGGGAVA